MLSVNPAIDGAIFGDNFAPMIINIMETKITLSKDFCKMDAIRYVATRYGTTPEQVLEHYFVQTGIISSEKEANDDYELQDNELALFHDLGVQPSIIEIS